MKTKILTRLALLSATAFILQIIGGYLPKIGGFLEIEFSDFPAILAAFSFGPLCGIIVELIKNMLHLLTFSTTGGIGEFANFVVNSSFVAVCGIMYKQSKTKKTALASLLVSTLVMTVVGTLVNFFVMIPLYMPGVDFKTNISVVLKLITPFNFCKGLTLSFLTFFLYKKISPLLK